MQLQQAPQIGKAEPRPLWLPVLHAAKCARPLWPATGLVRDAQSNHPGL